jgi:hypothetical protein
MADPKLEAAFCLTLFVELHMYRDAKIAGSKFSAILTPSSVQLSARRLTWE